MRKSAMSHDNGTACGCKEHNKYKAHSALHASQWIMIVLKVCRSPEEAKLLERLIIRKVKPSLNRFERRTFRKYTYENNYTLRERKENQERRQKEKQAKRGNKNAPWVTGPRPKLSAPEDARGVTYFWLKPGGARYLDLIPVMSTLAKERRSMEVH